MRGAKPRAVFRLKFSRLKNERKAANGVDTGRLPSIDNRLRTT
jgi:hypothetical protein